MDADDPVAEFLEREKTELADIEGANEYPLGNEHDLASGHEIPKADLEDGFLVLDSAGGTFNNETAVVNGVHNDFNGFTEEPAPLSEPVVAPHVTPGLPKIEPEKIRRWREEQKIRLENKDADEEKEKTKLREQGKKELEEWYRNRADQLEKSKKSNRVAEHEFTKDRDADQPGLEWERITRLCEFNPKAAKNTKDISRFRSLLLQLKQN